MASRDTSDHYDELDRFYFVIGEVLTKNVSVGLEALVNYLEETQGFTEVDQALADLDGRYMISIDANQMVKLL